MKSNRMKKLKSGIAVAFIVISTVFALPASASNFSFELQSGGSHYCSDGYYCAPNIDNQLNYNYHYPYHQFQNGHGYGYDSLFHHGHIKHADRFYAGHHGFGHNSWSHHGGGNFHAVHQSPDHISHWS